MPPFADVLQWEHLPFPRSLPLFQKLFPDDAACARWLEAAKWPKGFECPQCHERAEPFRFENRPGVLRCKSCRSDVSLKAGSVMEGTHSPLTTWFWGAYLVSTSTPGISAVQFQRQLGLTRYETAFQILHKLRAGMVRPGRDRIGGNLGRGDHVEIDETYVGGKVRGEGRGPKPDHTVLVAAAVEVRTRPPKKGDKPTRRGGRYAGRLRLEIVPNRGEKALCGFVEAAVEPGAIVITDAAPAYATLEKRGYAHLPVVEGGDPTVAEEFLPIVHLVFSNLKAWLQGTHHGRVEPKHLQAYLNEFAFRFNRRFYPFNAFRSLLGIGANGEAPTYDGLYSGDWQHPTVSDHG
jgi:ISXO2-like transposase domain/Transposase zinc-ribbon domain